MPCRDPNSLTDAPMAPPLNAPNMGSAGKRPTETDMLKAIKVLRLQPGDILVLRSTKPLYDYVREQMSRDVSDALATCGHAGVGVMVLDSGYDLELLRKAG